MNVPVLFWFGVGSLVATVVIAGYARFWRERGMEIAAVVMLGIAVIALSSAWLVSR